MINTTNTGTVNITKLLQDLRNISSTNSKIELIKKYKDDELLKKIFYYTFNTLLTYHIKKVTVKSISETNSLNDIFSILDDLNSRKITGKKAKETLNNFCMHLSNDDIEIVNLILNRNLKMGITATLLNSKVYPKIKLIPEFKVALASGEKNINKSIKYPAYAQKKMDGKRTIIIITPINNNDDDFDVKFYSRSGKIDTKLSNSEYLTNQVKSLIVDLPTDENGEKIGLVLDGESVIVDNNGIEIDRKTGNGILNRKEFKNKEMIYNVQITVWDIITLPEFLNKKGNVLYNERFELLQRLFSTYTGNALQLIPTQIVSSYKEAKEVAKNYIKNGFEGAIIKNINYLYEGKRSNHMIKIKDEKVADLKVIDYQFGTGIMEGYLGALVCASKNSKIIVNVGSGFSHEERGFKLSDNLNEAIPVNTSVSENFKKENIIGKIISVKFNEIIKDKTKKTYSLFLPRFLEIRDDKNEADSFEKIKNEIEV